MRRFLQKHAKEVVALVTLVTVFAYVVVTKTNGEISKDGFIGGTEQKEQFWIEKIQKDGGQSAADDFNRRIKKAIAPENWHINAHIFGAALYKQTGTDALGYCVEGFTFGCFHEVFKRLIAEKDDKNLAIAMRACEEKTGWWHPCHHALGHGLVSYYGHTQEGLLTALKVCDKYPEDRLNGCVGGAFMEYNLYTSLGLEVNVREPDPNDMYTPCGAVRETNMQACYLWLSQWLGAYYSTVKHLNPHEVAQKVGQVCEASPRKEFVRDCIERLGQQLSYLAQEDPAETRSLCSEVSKDKSMVMSCLSYAAWITQYIDSTQKKNAIAMCQDLAGKEKDYCVTFAEGKTFKAESPPLPQE